MEKLMEELKGGKAGGAMPGMEDLLKMLGGGSTDGLKPEDVQQATALWKMLDEMAENDTEVYFITCLKQKHDNLPQANYADRGAL
jgi:hypothetical protein